MRTRKLFVVALIVAVVVLATGCGLVGIQLPAPKQYNWRAGSCIIVRAVGPYVERKDGDVVGWLFPSGTDISSRVVFSGRTLIVDISGAVDSSEFSENNLMAIKISGSKAIIDFVPEALECRVSRWSGKPTDDGGYTGFPGEVKVYPLK